jgi:molecular chaperone HtpG
VELSLRPFVASAQAALDPLECEAVLRSFEPAAVPAIYLLDRDAAFRHDLRTTRDRVDPMWTEVLSALDSTARDSRPQLVLNYRNPLVRRLTAIRDHRLVGTSVEALYGQALLMGHHPMRPADSALLNRSFLALLERAVPGELS